jgi:nucleotide-binding universal stress UspA family protein
MMKLFTKHDVVVGVDGSPAAMAAAHYARWQAELRGLDLVLTHSYSIPALQEPLSVEYFTGLHDAGEALLNSVVSLLEIPAAMSVRTLLQQTTPASLLKQAATSSGLVVIGQPASGWYERLTSGGVAHSLVKGATCPVVLVPAGWRPLAPVSQPVVVALTGTSAAAEALAIAFNEADLRGTGVLALHVTDPQEYPPDEAGQKRNIVQLLAGSKQDFPHVPIDVQVVRGKAVHALLEFSAVASLLVVTASHGSGLGSWTLSVAQGVLRRAECPVVVAPSGVVVAPEQQNWIATTIGPGLRR